jgi:hypothetical protein
MIDPPPPGGRVQIEAADPESLEEKKKIKK